MLLFKFDDAGRSEFRKHDCVIRAITIAAELPYNQVFEDLGSPDTSDGIHWQTYHPYLRSLGWEPTSLTYKKEKVIPTTGRIILESRFHVAAVIDGVVHDTQEPAALYEDIRAKYPRMLPWRDADDWTSWAWCYWTK
jgi:hypothetical protein